MKEHNRPQQPSTPNINPNKAPQQPQKGLPHQKPHHHQHEKKGGCGSC